jgi:hypothetical protein
MNTFMNAVLTRRIAMLLVVLMGIFSFVPRVEAAFVPSDESFSSSLRQKDMEVVQKALEHRLVKERLKAMGYTEKEVADRLDQLSEAELHRFATHLDSLTPGGDTLGIIIAILVIIALLLVILHLVDKRIIIK